MSLTPDASSNALMIKVCGVTSAKVAVACVEAGVDAIGVNCWPGSPRHCGNVPAAIIAAALRGRARVVGVVVNASARKIDAIRELGISWIQLHGEESPAEVGRWLPEAYKAVHLDGDTREFPGDELLVDARAGDLRGGTGLTCDWEAAARLARTRKLWLAGGLTPENVADAIRAVRPYGVDVASGVEKSPRVQDLEKVARFVANARAAG